MNEKEVAELEKLKADKEKIEADTYKLYVDMGVLEPYQVKFLKYGNTLDTIPVPAELDLPPVETTPAPEDEPKEGDDTESEPEEK